MLPSTLPPESAAPNVTRPRVAVHAEGEEARLALRAVATAVGARTSRGGADGEEHFALCDGASVEDAKRGGASSSLVLLRQAELTDILEQLQKEGVAAVVAADPHDLRSAVRAAGELAVARAGIRSLIDSSASVRQVIVVRQAQRESALEQVRRLTRAMGLRAQFRATVEMVIDELLMNALYNAPVDDAGRHIFADVPPAERVKAELDAPVTIELAYDGRRLHLSVSDTFGSLDREAIMSALRRCSGEVRPSEKTSGAGLGLYFVLSNVAELFFRLDAGRRSEVVVVFDTSHPKQQLCHFGIYPQQDLPAPEVVGEPRDQGGTELAASAPRGGLVMALLVVLTVVALGLAAYAALSLGG